jgi:mannose-6-phosphate isomerase
MNNLYPIKMTPAFKDYLWGGDKLIKEWAKPCPTPIAAESWELSGHKNGQSIAENGELKGLTLSEIVEKWGKECLGENSKSSDRFPILIKLIDSKQKLSIQVHPDDAYSLKNEGEFGKTEMWYIVDAEPNSGLMCGFKKDITKEEYSESIKNNTLTELLNFIPVQKGDTFFIAPGTVHAICEGTIIAEIQQNSDITYRVFDYGRVGADGKERPLHIEKALDVSNLKGQAYNGKPIGEKEMKEGFTQTLLASCQYFTVFELAIENECLLNSTEESFSALTFTEGNGIIQWENGEIAFKKGDTFFIPAKLGAYKIFGKATVLLSNV